MHSYSIDVNHAEVIEEVVIMPDNTESVVPVLARIDWCMRCGAPANDAADSPCWDHVESVVKADVIPTRRHNDG